MQKIIVLEADNGLGETIRVEFSPEAWGKLVRNSIWRAALASVAIEEGGIIEDLPMPD